jgi:hypothetical protein
MRVRVTSSETFSTGPLIATVLPLVVLAAEVQEAVVHREAAAVAIVVVAVVRA